jgi:putative ABC transport system permease protein
MLSLYLAIKEMARNKRRFISVFLIVALITLLVLFTAALADGLSQGASEFFDRVGGELIVFQQDVDFQMPASRLGQARLSQIRRVPGVAAVGPVGASTAALRSRALMSRWSESSRCSPAHPQSSPAMS